MANKTTEGEIKLYLADTILSRKSKTFFNPRMKLPRDVSVYIAKHYSVKSFIDCMSASGVRALRIMKEAHCREGIANDINPHAVKLIEKNSQLNNISLTITNKDCKVLDYHADYIDIDPFGSPAPFIFSPIAGLQKDAILAVTATDIGVLFGRYPSTCKRKYLANSEKTIFSRELGIRILMGYLQRIAAISEKKLLPIFCHTDEHYLRVYMKAVGGEASAILNNISEITYCKKCFSINKQNCCQNIVLGPIWKGKLFDDALTRNFSLIKHIKEEANINVIGYYNLIEICKKEKINTPKMDSVIEKIKALGYKASRTHFEDAAIKTDMPLEEFRSLLTR